jgi:hypothetical protein
MFTFPKSSGGWDEDLGIHKLIESWNRVIENLILA